MDAPILGAISDWPSRTRKSIPAFCRELASVSPAMPPPTIITRNLVFDGVIGLEELIGIGDEVLWKRAATQKLIASRDHRL